ncbi:hypothetical protein LENED_009276 [Lentinula edodes]|uniref:Uncharacterized protein n=1 Tax=Lentinula edodes TaxID=5353 RepID=A0A1Q3EJE7_LENED|nr:hypothetical protein LENED_009276 [Lentinula edodes]
MKTRFFHNESWEESSGAAVINENSLAYAILSHNPPVMRFTCLFLFFALLSAAHAAPTPPENHSAAAAGARKRIYIKFDHGTSTVQASTRLLRSQIGYMVESWKPGWKSNFGNVKFEFITYLDTNDDKPYTAWISV